MPMTLQQPKHDNQPESESRANDLVKRIRKLRWMGMEEEAQRLQAQRCLQTETLPVRRKGRSFAIWAKAILRFSASWRRRS